MEGNPLKDNVQVEREPIRALPKPDEKSEVKTPEISPERIERMKRAFKPTWLHEQINAGEKTSGGNGKKG